MATDRDAWTAYAEREGLIRPAPASSASSSRTSGRPGRSGPGASSSPTRPNKYGARRVQVDGLWFDSVKESARYQTLKVLRDTGAIDELELQPVFPLHVMEIWRSGLEIRIASVGVFRADFRYRDLRTGEIRIEDVKSPYTRTEAYNLRKRIAEAVHGVTIDEL